MCLHDRAGEVLDVLDVLYEAVEAPARWPAALQRVAALLDVQAAGVRIETKQTAVRQTWIGLEPSFDKAYVDHYWRHDPWAASVLHAPVKTVGHGDAIVSRAVVERSAFHNELARPHGLDELVGVILQRSATHVISFGAMRGIGYRFEDADDRVLERILPHLTRAIVLTERLHSADAGAASEAEAESSARLTHRVSERLRADFGLTPAEVHVALRIAHGLSPKQIAHERGTSWYTIRAQLRQVLDKTACHSQSALARTVTLLEAHSTHDLLRGD